MLPKPFAVIPMRFLLSLLVLPLTVSAQSASDTIQAALIRIRTDSTRAETCRGGTLTRSASGTWSCSRSTAAPRVTNIRRHQERIDSLVKFWLQRRPAETMEITFGPITESHYASTVFGFPVAGVDTVTVCARIHYQNHANKVGWPAVRVQFIGDSARIVTRGGNSMTQMCGPALEHLMHVAPNDSVPIVWEAKWFTIRLEDGTTRRRLLPFAVPPAK